VKPTLVVAGSLNMDFVVSVDRLPAPGETVLGRDSAVERGRADPQYHASRSGW